MAQGKREVIVDRKQAVLLGSGVVLALILVFVLGVLFGRNMADRKDAKDQSLTAEAALTREEPKPVPAATAEKAAPAAGETAIRQKIEQQKVPAPQIAKGATIAKTGLPAPAPGKTTAKPADTKPLTTVQAAAATTIAKPATTAPAPAKPAPAPTKPAPEPSKPEPSKETAPTPAKSGPVIQVASYPDKPSADGLVAKLKTDKWPAMIQQVEIPGKGTYYRVCLGPYASAEQANKALMIFKSKEPNYQDAFVRK